MGNTVFRECCSSSSDISRYSDITDITDNIDNIDETDNEKLPNNVYSRDEIYDINVSILKTSPGPPIFA
jgi:predicted AlkP superfamily phosphohydrolase/phosphomutase